MHWHVYPPVKSTHTPYSPHLASLQSSTLPHVFSPVFSFVLISKPGWQSQV